MLDATGPLRGGGGGAGQLYKATSSQMLQHMPMMAIQSGISGRDNVALPRRIHQGAEKPIGHSPPKSEDCLTVTWKEGLEREQ